MGNIVYALCLWGILSVLTKMGSLAIVGRFALASAIATPVIMFASLQLRSVLAADADNTHQFRDYLSVRLLLLPIALLVILFIALLRSYAPEQVTAIMLFGLARSVESVSDIFYGVAQKHDRMDIVAISRGLKGVAALVLFGLTFHFTGSLDHALLALAIAWTIPLLAYDIPRVRRLNQSLQGAPLTPCWRPLQWRSIIWTTLPLGLVILLGQMRQTIPRTFLESAFDEDTVGIYAALSYVVVAGSTIVMALGQSSLARLSNHYAAGRMGAFKKLGGQLAMLGLGLGLAGVLFGWLAGPFVLKHLYRAEYATYADLFVLIMAAGGLFYVATLLAPMTTAMKAFRGQMVVQIINVAVLLILAPQLIPRYAMVGAVWTVMAGTIWTVAGFTLLIWLGIKRQSGWKNPWLENLFR